MFILCDFGVLEKSSINRLYLFYYFIIFGTNTKTAEIEDYSQLILSQHIGLRLEGLWMR